FSIIGLKVFSKIKPNRFLSFKIGLFVKKNRLIIKFCIFNRKREIMKNVIKQEMQQLNYEDIVALVIIGVVVGIVVIKITGYSKTLGAVAGVGLSLLFYGILNKMRK